ncbi:pilus assembly PilX family protein [Chitinilyticum litopenaei]|uniref:pilus assembly PilX family protein n=1 Tax=Chitinilyticum litopenaei TaxID=1121276 RepID=UPI0004114908|nr:PilX N-terminal domain-containing pilus assembly protein [Chitinilyticum litopenaei]
MNHTLPARRGNAQRGFVLIITLLLLVIVTLLVINGMRSTTLNEKMAGNYMDRNRAYQAAEQAMRQGAALLQANAEACLAGCSNADVVGVGTVANALPAAWSDQHAGTATTSQGQQTSGKYLINQLPDALLPADKSGCKAYSVMGRGQGLDQRAVVVLQTTALVCPI